MSYVDRKFAKGVLAKPTDWAPNGCGSHASKAVVPDGLLGVDFVGCCDLHDLAYHQGGFFGLFTRKPIADFGLAMCLWAKFSAASHARFADYSASGDLKGMGLIALGLVVCPLYFAAVTAVGWLPFIWRWRYAPTNAFALNSLKRKLQYRGLA